MKRFGCVALLRVLLGACLIAVVPLAFAQVTPTHLTKHARKIEHRLNKFQTGSYLHLVLADAPDTYGALGRMSNDSFTFTDADNNTTSTYNYEEVTSIKTDKEPIGMGTEPRRHFRMLPMLVGAAALGAGAGIYMAMR